MTLWARVGEGRRSAVSAPRRRVDQSDDEPRQATHDPERHAQLDAERDAARRQEHRQRRDAEDDPPPNSIWPYSTRTSREWKRGQQLGATESNASGQSQQRVASTYAFRDEGTPDPTTTRKFRGMSINYFSAGWAGGTYVYNAFEVISAWAYQDGDTTVVYDEAGTSSFSTTRTSLYGNPNHVQLTELKETNSNGTERIARVRPTLRPVLTGEHERPASLARRRRRGTCSSPATARASPSTSHSAWIATIPSRVHHPVRPGPRPRRGRYDVRNGPDRGGDFNAIGRDPLMGRVVLFAINKYATPSNSASTSKSMPRPAVAAPSWVVSSST